MSEDELKAIEARVTNDDGENPWDGVETGARHVIALAKEVRRLRGLLQAAADENDGAPSGHCCLNCPWCHGEGYPFRHAENCTAYTVDGRVR